MSDLIFNLRIWRIHFQITKHFKVVPMFAWYNFWVGLFFDTKKSITYIFPIPMVGIRIEGFRISWNKAYSFRKYPFIQLFRWGNKHF